MRKSNFDTYAILFVIVALLCGFGWVANIVAIVSAISDPVTVLLILRCIGVFIAPLGVVLGFV